VFTFHLQVSFETLFRRVTLKVRAEPHEALHACARCHSCPILTQVGACVHMLVKLLSINFREDPLCSSSGVTHGRSWGSDHFLSSSQESDQEETIKTCPTRPHCTVLYARATNACGFYTNAVQKTERGCSPSPYIFDVSRELSIQIVIFCVVALCSIHRTGISVSEAQAASILGSSISPPPPFP
jgi:hypothetical protein